MSRAEWDTLRGLHGRKRLAHIWAYYKLPIVGILILAYLIGYAGWRQLTRRDNVLYLALVNVAAGQDLTDTLTDGFLADQGLAGTRAQVYVYSGLVLRAEGDDQYVYASGVKLLGAAAAQRLDVVLMDAEARDELAEAGYLADLRQLDPTLTEADGLDGTGLWLDVSAAPAVAEAGFSDRVYLGVISQAPHPDRAAAFIRYLLG